jgi:hypothetical protein
LKWYCFKTFWITYEIKNSDSRSTAIFTFFDAMGKSVQKLLKPGESAQICARADTVSAITYKDKMKIRIEECSHRQ